MPITQDEAKTLVKRLRGLPFDGDSQDESGRRQEVGRALIAATENIRHAESVTDHLMRSSRFFPVPLDVWNAAESVAPPATIGRPAETCGRCSGSGFERVNVRGMDAVTECGCRRVSV